MECVDEEVRELETYLDLMPIMSIGQWTPSFEPLISPQVKIEASLVQPYRPERKPVPSDLKYAFLGEDESYPIVILSKLKHRAGTRTFESGEKTQESNWVDYY